MIYEQVDDAGVVCLCLSGELDLVTGLELELRLSGLRSQDVPVRVDLAQLEFIDSSGLRVLITALKRARDEGWALEIGSEVGEWVRRVIDICQLRNFFWPAATEPRAAQWPGGRQPSFADPDLLASLEGVEFALFDALEFGLVVMDQDGKVLAYNANESRRSGLDAARVIGRNFFTDVGPCTNNHLIAERYREQRDLDDVLDYVFTFRMKATPVTLRMLARDGSAVQYLAVRDR